MRHNIPRWFLKRHQVCAIMVYVIGNSGSRSLTYMGAQFAALLADRFGNLVRATQIEEREVVRLTHSIREQVIWLVQWSKN